MNELTAARAYADTRHWADALRALAPVIAARPDDVDALLLVAHCRLGQRDAAGALTAADAAGAARPDSAAVAITRSRALLALQRRREARDAADRAIQLAPDDVRTHVQRVDVDTSTRRLTKAGRASARTALRLAPTSPAVHVAMGNVEFVRRRIKSARACYAEALRLDPTNRAAQYNLASISQRFGSSAQAITLALGLIRIDPGEPGYVLLLRRSMMRALILALVGSAIAALFITPGPGAGASRIQAGFVLAVCLALQIGALVWLRLKVGRPALRVLIPTGGLRWPMRVGIGLALLADLFVVLAFLVAPSDDAETLGALAMILFLLAIAGVALSTGIRTR